ncbi:Uncharacterised protein [Mycobacteroides abscessus subsp. abscessus]|nr:Uncharacterised protein [Mycobacteroides abscessus subsp. abscessus]
MIARETMTTSNSGTKIMRSTVGMIFFSHGSTTEASHAATIIGKIEYVYEAMWKGRPKNSALIGMPRIERLPSPAAICTIEG